LIKRKQVIPKIDDLLPFHPNNVSAETKNERQDSDNNLDDKNPSHTYQHLVDTNLILPL